jgi:hypothetical protein
MVNYPYAEKRADYLRKATAVARSLTENRQSYCGTAILAIFPDHYR